MSTVKSFSVGNGDMFYINHGSDNFTIIDCCLSYENESEILDEVAALSAQKSVTRFISTHPDEDHIRGLIELDKRLGLLNFYCVENDTRKSDETPDFLRYKQLRDSDKAFYIFKGCSRRWMNQPGDGRGASGINILWPDTSNLYYKMALGEAARGESPNNISAIVQYSLDGGGSILWMGDLETDFLQSIESEVKWPAIDILFAPHHGRWSGRVPESILELLNPRIIVIGEAESDLLCYYQNYNTITQNSAGDILFDLVDGRIDVYTSKYYTVNYLTNMGLSRSGYFYLGSMAV